jgi:hypothetical protein
MTTEVAKRLVTVRLLEAATLLESMLGNLDAEQAEVVSCALGAVADARIAIDSLAVR